MWYSEKAVIGMKSGNVNFSPMKKFKTYEEAKEWFDKHKREPISIWFQPERGSNQNDCPSGKDIFETDEFKKMKRNAPK